MYKHPDRLIGKTVQCESKHILVSLNKSDLLSLDAELAEAAKTDPKNYGSRSVGGMMTAASALNNLATGKENKYSIIFHYLYTGRLTMVEGGNEPVKVKIVGATDSSDKFPLVQVKVVNGPKAGTIWWTNTDQLELTAQDRG